MKQRAFLSLLLLAIPLTGLFAQNGEIAYTYAKDVVAVYPFLDKSRSWRDEGNMITDLVTGALVSMNRFDIVSRENVEEAFKMMELELAGALDDITALKVAKLRGYTKAITGSMVDVSSKVSRIPKTSSNMLSYSMRANLKVLDVATGEIIHSTELSAHLTYTYNRRAGRDAVYLVTARNAALSSIQGQIKEAMFEAFPIALRISARQKNKFILSVGSAAQVRKGDKFKVYEEGKTLTMPNGEFLTREKMYKATVRVTKTEKERSVVSVARGGGVKLGDVAEEMRMAGIRTSLYFGYQPFVVKNTDGRNATFSIDEHTVLAPFKLDDATSALSIMAKIGMAKSTVQPELAIAAYLAGSDIFAFDVRFGLGVTFRLLGEVLQLSIIPNVSLAFATISLGTTTKDLVYSDANVLAGSSIHGTSLGFGAGGQAALRYTVNDSFGLSAYGGYRYYPQMNNWSLSVTDDKDASRLAIAVDGTKIPTLDLMGPEFGITFDWSF